MKLVSFSILTLLALIYAGLSVAESAMYHTWDRAINEQRSIQIKINYYQRMDNFIEQFLRRLAVDSQHDPAVADLLKKRNIRVVVTPEAVKDPAATTPSADATTSTPAAQ